METEYFQNAKEARRAEIVKILEEMDAKQKKSHLSTDGNRADKSKLERELAEIDGIKFSDQE